MEVDPTPDWYGSEDGIDEERLATALDDLRPRLRRMLDLRIQPRLKARIDPSDVLQDTFLEATQRADTYAVERKVPFFVWVRFLAIQKLAQAHRRHLGAQKRDVRREVRARDLGNTEASSVAMAGVFAASLTTPSQHLEKEERKAAVLSTLDSLDTTDREILALRHIEGLSNRECGQVLGLTDAGASRRYMRAAARFAGALESRGFDPSTLGAGRA